MLHTWPLRPYYPITRGSDGHIADGQRAAVDLACPRGVPWVAVHDGVITAAITDPNASDCGIQTDLAWGDVAGNWLARYCHGAAQESTVGQHITAGQRIGSVGVTGNTTGPHLHLALWLDGVRLRPEDVLAVPGAPPEEPATGAHMTATQIAELSRIANTIERWGALKQAQASAAQGYGITDSLAAQIAEELQSYASQIREQVAAG